MSKFHRVFACAAAAAVLCLAPVTAPAGEVAPGQRIDRFDPDDTTQPFVTEADPVAGEVLATSVVPYDVDDAGEPGQLLFARGTLTSRVVRELGRVGLTFEYLLEQSEQRGVVDLEDITLRAFNGFATDVRTASDLSYTVIERSADGQRLRLAYNEEDLAEYLIVRTNAPAYAPGGTFAVHWDFPGSPNPGFGTEVLATFQPVPEPGVAAVLLAAGGALLRRRRGTTRP